MSRQIRALLGLVLVSCALAATACADATAPRPSNCDMNNSNTCPAPR